MVLAQPPTSPLLLQKQGANPSARAWSPKRGREQIKPQLCPLPGAAAPPGPLQHPPTPLAVCFPNFSAANQASWKEKE